LISKCNELFFSISVIIYPIRTVFSNNNPTIVINEKTNSTKTPAPSTLTLSDLTEEEKEKLNEGILP